MTFVQLGGTVGDWCLSATGTPRFRSGEEVLVFLKRRESFKSHSVASDRWLLGLGQGVWRIERDERTGAAQARIGLEVDHVVRRPGQLIESRLSLHELTGRIAATVEAARRAQQIEEGK